MKSNFEIHLDHCNVKSENISTRKRLIKDENTIRESAPTKLQLKEVRTLLNDFGISVKIPQFQTFRELDQWKTKIIKAYFDNGGKWFRVNKSKA